MTIGQLIKERRKKRGLTQKELAAAVGAAYGSISEWESGKHVPNNSAVIMLCNVLEIPIDEMIKTEETGEAIKRYAEHIRT